MTIICDSLPRGGCRIAMQGHAGRGPRGADPVCAALSMLMYTAAQTALEASRQGLLSGSPLIRLERGDSLLELTPALGRRRLLRERLLFARTGFRLLARRYPDCVTIKEA